MFSHAQFHSRPALVHGHGRHRFKPYWDEIKNLFFAGPHQVRTVPSNLTLITCNNGHEAMGLFERSCELQNLPYLVGGRGRTPWLNSRDKPLAILELLAEIETEYVLYADSRDALVVGDLHLGLQQFRHHFSDCQLLMGADRINWPNLKSFKEFEESLPGGEAVGGCRYLNGGVWLGRTEFCRHFFQRVLETTPVPEAPDSEQGLLKQLFPEFYPAMQLDYRSHIVVNLGFATSQVLELSPCPTSPSTASSDIA